MSGQEKKQKGQAMVFVYLFLSILVVATVSLYKAGKLTSDKMEMQNAADSAAYSISVIEARDLNFASYMNRAIVANEVATGQMVGLYSWYLHWVSFKQYLDVYATALEASTVLAPLGGALRSMGTGFQTTGNSFIKPVVEPIAKGTITATRLLNQFYGMAEYLFHGVSTVYALGAMNTMITQNAPPGARISEFGMLSLIGHISTYGAIPQLPGEKFTRSYDPTTLSPIDDFKNNTEVTSDSSDAAGYGRLAAIIQESGDPFTRARGWRFDLFKVLYDAGILDPIIFDETLNLGPFSGRVAVQYDDYRAGSCCWFGAEFDLGIDLGFVRGGMGMHIYIRMALAREGGSELRMVVPSGTQASGEYFSWSSADTTNLEMGLDLGGYMFLELVFDFGFGEIVVPLIDVGVSTTWNNDRLKIYFGSSDAASGEGEACEEDDPDTDDDESENCGSGSESTDANLILDAPVPSNAPFGAAIAQAGSNQVGGGMAMGMGMAPMGSKSNFLAAKPAHMGREGFIPPGPVPVDAYGGAAGNMIAWDFPVPPGIYWQASHTDKRFYTKYKGLPRYVDTADNNPLVGLGGPNVVMGVVQSEASFDLGPQGGPAAPEPTGSMQLTENMAANSIHAIAKSEVYFKRPTDLSYFRRGDSQEEYGSAFNPYWQARLTETSHADRDVALLLQQQVNIDEDAATNLVFNFFNTFSDFISDLADGTL